MFGKNMKLAVAIILSLIIGFGAGWFSFRSKEMAGFRDVVKKAGITNEQLIEAYKAVPAIMENMESDARGAAVISLAALRALEANKIEETKRFLARQSASYFVIYGPLENPRKKITAERKSTLEAIEKARQQSQILDAAIAASLENLQK